MPYTKILFKPGIDKEGTSLTAENGWFDGNLVRFRRGLPEKVGGWAKNSTGVLEGTPRAMHDWVNLDGTDLLGVGTTYKYYIQQGSDFNDITPIRETTSAGDATFAKVANSDATITVTENGHGASINDYVTFSGAAALDGGSGSGNITASVLNQEYQITSIVDANSYTIEAKDTNGNTVLANASDSGNGGGSTVAAYQLNVGLDTYVSSTGWGAGGWSSGSFGSVTPLSANNTLRLWTHDNFGEDLIINPRAGSIFRWDNSNGLTTRAVELQTIAGANLVPTRCLQVLTSDVDRHLIVLGSDSLNANGTARTGTIDPLLISFSDQENLLEFEAKATNTAGSIRISSGSLIVGGLKARQEILIWTDVSMHSMQFIGAPFTFGLNLINDNVGLIGPKAVVNGDNGIYWMSSDGFYFYNGSVSKLPCSVLSHVFDDLNLDEVYKNFAFTNREFNEVGWFYCSASSTEPDKYVVYNYIEQVWSIGELERYSWIDKGIFSFPLATGKSGNSYYLYNHETGNDNDGSPMDNVFIESGDFDIEDGDKFYSVREIIPDIKFTGSNGNAALNVVLKTRDFPNDSPTEKVSSSITNTTKKIDTRARARQAIYRVESDDDNDVSARNGLEFRLGATRFNFREDGKR